MPSPPSPLCGRPVSLYGHASVPYPDLHADPARAPLLLPDRLAPALGRDPVRARSGTLRGLRATARAGPVVHLGDGRWWDAGAASWRDGRGRRVRVQPGAVDILGTVRRTRVVLAAAHCDHDTANNADANLAAFCQRCHIIHDRPEHRRRRWTTLFRRKALGDLFRGPYA